MMLDAFRHRFFTGIRASTFFLIYLLACLHHDLDLDLIPTRMCICAAPESDIQEGFWQLGVIIRPMNRTNEPHLIGLQGCQRVGWRLPP